MTLYVTRITIAGLTALSLSTAAPVLAQDADEESGGRLVRLLENTLSGDGRTIRVVGLEGALSSRATIRRIEVSDDTGVWFTLENAVLDWNRLALVRGRFSVNELSAEKIIVARPPGTTTPTAEDLPTPEATPFQVPELPVAINIGQIEVAEIELGEPVLGTPATLSLDGNVRLEDGTLDALLNLDRLDRDSDDVVIDTSFDNATRQLDLDIRLTEAPGGLVGTLANLPGNPSIDLSIDGRGPLEQFVATLALETDDQLRFGGDVTLQGLTPEDTGNGTVEQGPLRFAADLGGDIRPLLPEQFHEFFGGDTRILANGQRNPDGALSVEALRISSEALSLDGALDMGADGAVQVVVLQGGIRPVTGEVVTLPVPGQVTTVEQVSLSANYDVTESRDWALDLDVEGLASSEFTLDTATITGSGQTGATPDDDLIGGTINAEIAGLAMSDAALDKAIGDTVSLDGGFRLINAGELILEAMNFTGGGLQATVDATLDGLDSGLELDTTTQLTVADLSRFDALADRPLAGALSARLEGNVVPLSGAFDIRLTGTAQDLQAGIAEVDPLLTGQTDLVIDAARDETGVTLRAFNIDGTAITAEAQGALSSTGTQLTFDAEVDDLARVVPDLPGPGRITGDLQQDGEAYVGNVDLTAPKGISLTANGRYEDGASRANVQGSLDDLGVFVPQLPGEAQLSADITQDGEIFTGDLNVSTADGSEITADGTYGPAATNARLNATLTDLGIFVPQLPGEANVTGRIQTAPEDPNGFTGTLQVRAADGSTIVADGTYAAASTEATINGVLTDLGLFVPQLPGEATITGEIKQNGSDYDGTLTAETADGSEINAEGTYGPGRTEGTFDAALANLGIFVPQMPGRATVTGQVRQDGEAYTGTVQARTADGSTANARGTYGPDQLQAQFDAALTNLGIFVPQMAGRASVTGEVTQTGEAYDGTVQANAADGSRLNATGTYGPGQTKGRLNAELMNLAAFVPQMPGRATVTANVEERDNAYRGTVEANTANGSTLSARGAYGEAEKSVTFNALLAQVGAFVDQLSGNVRLQGTASEGSDGAYSGNVTADGTAGVTLNASGSLTPQGAANVTYEATLARVERFVPDFPGTLRSQGTASRNGDRWTIDSSSTGPAGLDARVAGSYNQANGTADVTAQGQALLAAANAFISPMAVSGPAQFNLRLNGQPALQSLSGTIDLPGTRVAIPQIFGQIDPLTGRIALNNGQAQIDLRGQWLDGGSFTVNGPVTLSAPYNSGIDVVMNGMVLTDQALYRTVLDGQVGIDGPLVGNGQISGVVNVGRTELNIAATSGGAGGSPIPNIRHEGEDRASYLTRQRAGLTESAEDSEGGEGGGGPGYGLNVTISAPQQIFVRGRGLDAELGGGLTLRGTTNNIVPAGQIDLIRGRLDIVGRRLELDRGQVTLEGSFDPYIDFEASNTSSAGTAMINIYGPLQAPQVEVTSNPDRPAEEALGMLIFGDQFANLSPLRIAQLANSLAILTGTVGADGGLLGSARNSLGAASLDLTTDSEGNAQVGVGAYLSDEIYTDVTVNTEGRTELNLNLDLTDRITAKGTVDSEGQSALGLFFSKDF
ncbi:translocation/assembly module TamB domain-containing protein [Marinibacterium profundimaris]|uniref:Translocation and assembly module TamB C-terminal domain-containing protein n=1 Tax=Marinibacterium profundimaris TaxID=1679460 RepID=A0A225NH10_9RHOB|nr:translocation/assembly module TamB domain-containing protein [Marinibacterium profundimaris]OWU72964.1 hypothetical protein ATO3_14875 [Marinibacterium profundimaris]